MAPSELSDRSREVFRRIVEAYLESGAPVGSRTLSKALDQPISAATVRNVMQDLEEIGLLAAPHVSAGRMPTAVGLRLFVDELMEVGDLAGAERQRIEESLGDRPAGDLLDKAGEVLSGLTGSASLVLAPKRDAPIRHFEIVSLAPDRALAVLVTEDGQVENRVFSPPPGLPPSALRQAANFLTAVLAGRTLGEIRETVEREIAARRQELDGAAASLIEAGLAVWSKDANGSDRLIVRGASHLLEGASAEDLERVRGLFDELERKRDLVQLLELAEAAAGVKVFIGAETTLFALSGSSVVVSPYMDADRRIVGAVGVIGPTRLNYGRIVPIVDYTAQLVGRLISAAR